MHRRIPYIGGAIDTDRSGCHLRDSDNIGKLLQGNPTIAVLLISYFFAKFRNNKYVEAAFLGLRPATVGLIAAAALLLMNKENFIDYKSFLIFGAAFILTWKFKVHPILMIILAGIAGIILYW